MLFITQNILNNIHKFTILSKACKFVQSWFIIELHISNVLKLLVFFDKLELAPGFIGYMQFSDFKSWCFKFTLLHSIKRCDSDELFIKFNKKMPQSSFC